MVNLKAPKREVFNLKDNEYQINFKQDTDNTTELSKIFDKDDNVEKLTKKFLNRLDGFFSQTLKKNTSNR